MTKKDLTNDEEAALERLRSAVWYTVQQIVDEECRDLKTEATPQFVASLATLVFNQCITLGEDLESFARHAKRKTINNDDIKMVCRRNDGLQAVIDEFLEEEQQELGKQ